MSQNDFNIANQGFPATRADINSALQALASNSAGTAEPSTTYAYQFWYDETNELLKMRNSDNDAWITIGSFDQTGDTFTPAGLQTDKIEEGNSSVEVVDTGTGYVAITVDGAEVARFNSSGNIGIGTTSPSSDAISRFIAIDDATSSGLVLDGARKFSIYSSVSSSLVFRDETASTNRALIDSSGNLQFNSGYGSVATAYGCRAWVNWNGNTGSISGSGNVSSATRTSTGAYDINFATNMPDTNYAVACCSGEARVDRGLSSNGLATNKLAMVYKSTAGSFVDGNPLMVVIMR